MTAYSLDKIGSADHEVCDSWCDSTNATAAENILGLFGFLFNQSEVI